MKGSRIKSVEEMWEKICFDSIKSLRPSIKFTYIRDDGFEVESDMTNWLSCEVSPEEKNVLNEAEGVVVDLACGFGKHLLYISSVNNKIERLIGIEISKRIVDYNQRHNLEMICGDMCVFVETTLDNFDTVLIMGNSIAECGTLEKIKGLLKGIIEKLNFEGKVIISYKDFSLTDNQNHKEYHKNNYHNNMYCGITRLKLKYKDEYSKIKEYCYIDRTTLYKILNENRLTFIYEGFENGWNYTIWQKL